MYAYDSGKGGYGLTAIRNSTVTLSGVLTVPELRATTVTATTVVGGTSGTLTAGTGLSGSPFDGSADRTWSIDGTYFDGRFLKLDASNDPLTGRLDTNDSIYSVGDIRTSEGLRTDYVYFKNDSTGRAIQQDIQYIGEEIPWIRNRNVTANRSAWEYWMPNGTPLNNGSTTTATLQGGGVASLKVFADEYPTVANYRIGSLHASLSHTVLNSKKQGVTNGYPLLFTVDDNIALAEWSRTGFIFGSSQASGNLVEFRHYTGGAKQYLVDPTYGYFEGFGPKRFWVDKSGNTTTTGTLTVGSTLTLVPMTAGSVPFIGTSGLVSQDNSNFFFDDTDNELGVGNAAPLAAGHFTESSSGSVADTLIIQNAQTATGTGVRTIYAATTNIPANGNGRADETWTRQSDGSMDWNVLAAPGGAVAPTSQMSIDSSAKKVSFPGDSATNAGTGTGQANIGGTLNVNTTDVGNVGTGEDDLITYSVPANTLATNGDYLEFDVYGTFANNGNNKTVKIYFGATQLFSTTALNFSGAGANWRATGTIIRTGAATQEATVTFGTDNALLVSRTTFSEPVATLSGAVTFKCTGEATSNNDIVQEGSIVKWGSIGS